MSDRLGDFLVAYDKYLDGRLNYDELPLSLTEFWAYAKDGARMLTPIKLHYPIKCERCGDRWSVQCFLFTANGKEKWLCEECGDKSRRKSIHKAMPKAWAVDRRKLITRLAAWFIV